MASKRFCDRCDQPIVPADDEPFIRQDVAKNIQIALMVTCLNGVQVVPDICTKCKMEIVIDGTPLPLPKTEPEPTPEGQPIPFIHEVPKVMQMSPSIAGTGGGTKPTVFEPSLAPQPEKVEAEKPATKPRKAAAAK